MRITLLSALVVLSLQTCFASAPVYLPQAQPIDSAGKPAVHQKKGTIGFISGALLGPVGLGGVYLFTHNHAQRKAAKKGCVVFATVVVTVAFFWLIAKSSNGFGLGSGSSSSSNHSGSSASGFRGSPHTGGSASSGGSHGSGHSSNNDWSNFNWPNGGSSTDPKKRAASEELAADMQATLLITF